MTTEATLGLVGAAILIGQLVILRGQRTLLELDALHSVRDGWRDLQPAWMVSIAMGGGMYVRMTPSVIELFPEAQRIADIHDEVGHYVTEREGALARIPGDELNVPVRQTLEFLAFVSALILRGSLSPVTAYEALGPSIVRNSTPIRTLLNEPTRSGHLVVWYPGIADRVRVLIDILWVEAVRRKDISNSEIERATEVKRAHNTQYRNRARMRTYASGIGGLRRMAALEWHLTYAEVDGRWGLVRRTISRTWRLVRGWIAPPRFG